MEKGNKVMMPKLPRNWMEEIPDYVIDLSKIEYKKKSKLTEDGKMIKLLEQEGCGIGAESDATIYYTVEARYRDGFLCDPRANRKGINKIVLNRKEESLKAFEIALGRVKFGEIFWCKISGEFLKSLKYYKDLPPPLEGSEQGEIWCKFKILRIKHVYSKIYYDFPSLVVCIEDSKNIAKEYIELAKFCKELYEYALEIYQYWIQTFKQLRKEVNRNMTPENLKEKEKILLSLHLNVAYIKNILEEYLGAKAAAEMALEIDPENFKAAFRVAQASIKYTNLHERAYQCFKICFEKEPNNPALKDYAGWFDKYKDKKKNKKYNKWESYAKLIEKDEFKDKVQRKKERVQDSNEIYEEDKIDSEAPAYIAYDIHNDDESDSEEQPTSAEKPSEWDEIIKEEELKAQEGKVIDNLP